MSERESHWNLEDKADCVVPSVIGKKISQLKSTKCLVVIQDTDKIKTNEREKEGTIAYLKTTSGQILQQGEVINFGTKVIPVVYIYDKESIKYMTKRV